MRGTRATARGRIAVCFRHLCICSKPRVGRSRTMSRIGEAMRAASAHRRRFAPSMRQNFDLADIYADALKVLPATMDGQPPQPVSQTCPMTLDELLAARGTRHWRPVGE
jgi:hypothetical protein